MTDQSNTEVAPATEQTQAAPQLGLADLNAVVQIIDVCSKRGAFEGPELESVGAVRGRIAAFIQANAPKKEEPEEGEASEEPAAEEAAKE